MKDKQLLQSLKIEISQYKTFDCKLRHEQVIAVEVDTGTDYLGNALDPIVQRAGFCDRNLRAHIISCAHTMAANNFITLLNKIIIASGFKLPNSITEPMDKLFSKIYLIDIEKGSLEKQCAYARFNKMPEIEAKKINVQLRKTIEIHSGYVQELEILRQEIITELDRIL